MNVANSNYRHPL